MKERLSLKAAIGAALVAMLAGCAQTPDAPESTWLPDTTYKFTVLHTNDHHGRFWHNKYGEYGMAARKTLIDNLKANIEDQGGSVLLLSGGDINTGVPESDLQDAEPDFKGMSLIGYDAMALVTTNLITLWTYSASSRSGPTSQCFLPISMTKKPASVCSSLMPCSPKVAYVLRLSA